jgi:hypothetical protein
MAATEMPASAGEHGPGETTIWAGEGGDLLDADLVVAEHPHVGAELAEILHEVVGEAVVVVDHQQHGWKSFPDVRPASRGRPAQVGILNSGRVPQGAAGKVL